MKEHSPTKSLLKTLLGMRADRFTQTGRCRICGDEWQYSAPTEDELKRAIKDMGHLCPYCSDAGDEERQRMKKWSEDRASTKSKGSIMGFLFGTVFHIIILVSLLGCDPAANAIKSATTPSGATIELGMTIDDVHDRIGIPYKDKQYVVSPAERLWVYYLDGGAGKEDHYFVVGLTIKAGTVVEIFSARHEPKINCEVYHEWVKKISDHNKDKGRKQ
jgi:hypothetical protein